MRRLLKVAGMATIGVAVGAGISLLCGGVIEPFLLLMFAGLAYGWEFWNKHLLTVVGGTIPLFICLFLVKLFGAALIGWLILIFELILGMVEAVEEYIAWKKGKKAYEE